MDNAALLCLVGIAVSGALVGLAWSHFRTRTITQRAAADGQQSDGALESLQAGLEALAVASRELSAQQTLDSLLSKIAETCGTLLSSDSVGFRLLEGEELVTRALAGDAKDFMLTPRIKIGQSLSGTVAARGEPLVVANLVNDSRLIPEHREPIRRLGNRAWLGVPVKVGDRVVGVLSVRRITGFTPGDVAIATAFASQAASAIQNAELFEQVRQRATEVETLASINETLASTLDLDQVLQGVLDGALRIIRAERAVVYSLDETGRTLRARAVRGTGTSLGHPVKVGHAVVGSAVARRAPVACADVLTAPLPGADEFYEDHGTTLGEAIRRQDFRGMLATPLIAGDAVLGAICVYWRDVHEASAREIRLLTALARQAAVALDKSRIYMEATEQARQMKALAEIGRTLSGTLALDIVGERISESVRSLVSVKRATVYRLDAQTGNLTAVAKDIAPHGVGRHVPAGTALIGRALDARAPLSSPDVLQDPRVTMTAAQRERMSGT
jgi:GAF domain-containing protein